MDKYPNKNYNSTNKKEKGVISLLETITPRKLKLDQKQSITTKKMTAIDIRRKNGVRTATGKRLVELFKEGK
jgi:hypothetical protein